MMDIHEVGGMSLHFDKEIGCYVSCEHSDFSTKKFDDGAAWPPCRRLICTDQSYNSEERKFCGLVQFGGTWNGNVAIKYEITFDTQYLCVLSGRMVRIKVDGTEGYSRKIGQHFSYTNNDLDGRVDENTLKRLDNDGATETIMKQFRLFLERARKYYRRLGIDDVFDWMM